MSTEHLSIPFTDPVVVFALATLIFAAVPLLFERFRIPGIIGLIVAGAAVGPNGAALLERNETIVLLGTVGLLYLMFVAGVEIDLHGFRKQRKKSALFGAITFAIPQLVGTVLGLALGYGLAAAVLLGSLLASHTLVAYPIASRLGVSRGEAATVAVGGTILTDTAALLVLAVIAASAEGELGPAFWLRMVVLMTAFVGAVLLALPRIGRWFFEEHADGGPADYLFVLTSLFLSAALAEAAGVEPIIGAFLAGLALNRLIPGAGPLNNRLQFFGNAVFIPFFLLSVGMLVDVRVFTGSARAWYVMLGMTATVVASKWLAARITQQLFDYDRDEGMLIFGLTVPQAAATLAAALVGFELQILDEAVLNGAILMMLITCGIGPWIVERHARRLAHRAAAPSGRQASGPRRVLVAIPNPESAESLTDLALYVREEGSDEPVYPLIVVPRRSGREETEESVAAAEKLLSRSVLHGAAADVEVVPLTRIDFNYADGITRAITETRSGTVVVGWDRRHSRRFRLSGNVVERLISRTAEMLIVARLDRPLNTTRRLVVILPDAAECAPGFCEAVIALKTLANRLAAEIHGMSIGGSTNEMERQFAGLRPEVPATFERLRGWSDLPSRLRDSLQREDMVLLLSARRGTVAWCAPLGTLPHSLGKRLENNLLIIYPAEAEVLGTTPNQGEQLPATIDATRLILDLPSMTLERAIAELRRVSVAELEDGAGANAPDRAADAAALGADEITAHPHVAPATAIAEGRVRGLTAPLVALAISPSGIEGPGERIHLLFLLLSPHTESRPHLRRLAELSRIVRSQDKLAAFLGGATADSVIERFRTDRREEEVPVSV